MVFLQRRWDAEVVDPVIFPGQIVTESNPKPPKSNGLLRAGRQELGGEGERVEQIDVRPYDPGGSFLSCRET